MELKVTLNQIKAKNPCKYEWEQLLEGLNKTEADDEEFDAVAILEDYDLLDFCWVLDKVLNKQTELRIFAYSNALESLKYIPESDKEAFEKVINTVNLYAYGKVDDYARDSARNYAWNSAKAAAEAADSARNYAWNSAKAAAGTYIEVAAWASARDSAWASARDSAWASARDSALDSTMNFAKKRLVGILNGDLPPMYEGTNHFGERIK